MSPFKGFSKEVFECCRPSEKIRVPINSLKELRSEIEPQLRKVNPDIRGHVSKTKVAGTNTYTDWAWLYFNTVGPGAYRYSQLTVNISPSRIYVGVNLRTKSELRRLQIEIMKEENEQLLKEIVDTLGGREWIVSRGEDSWGDQVPRSYSPVEIRGVLFESELYWINACFEKDEVITNTQAIGNEIARIFTELYNIYALASDNKPAPQPKPKSKIYKPTTAIDSWETTLKSDKKRQADTRNFLASLRVSGRPSGVHLPGKRDQYLVKRTAVDLALKPYGLHFKGEKITIYSDRKLKPADSKILSTYPAFHRVLSDIEDLLQLPKGLLKIMYVDPKTDARYSRSKEYQCVFLNLARFKVDQSPFFWLFAVARELAYIRFPRLNYRFVNLLRDILTIGNERAFPRHSS